MDQRTTDTDPHWVVRTLTEADWPRLAQIDRKITGIERKEWFRGRVQRALGDSDVQVSLCAESDGTVVGAMLGTVQFGEFGQPQPVATLDTILVDPAFSGQGVGQTLLEHLTRNLRALRIDRVRTQIDWDERDLMGFLQRSGFVPVPRLVLELDLGG